MRPSAILTLTLTLTLLSAQTTSAFVAHARPPTFTYPRYDGLRSCMAADNVQAQTEPLPAQFAELEYQKSVDLPAAATSVAPSTPVERFVPSAPLPEGFPSAPLVDAVPPASLPVDDIATCATWDGEIVPCQRPEDLVDLGELFGNLKSVNQISYGIPSWQQLQQLDTLLPSIGVLVLFSVGYVGISSSSELLRPDDAPTARRKREERERLGVSEEDEEEGKRIAQEKWIGAVVPAILIVVFELALFNLRGA
uniref:Uncharacterized protein n=1 Tax=Coccolithus braarudii TaxID=221442 RepID=A0A7S0LNS3_9EUKA|mmetsp:Transcript_45742/g.97545  ORF Transcript_45742/g.97545 Transcript_45742/m.97545 type:complete len:252 (+) Transcript_45742:2-757(+)